MRTTSTPKRNRTQGETPPDFAHVNKKGKQSQSAQVRLQPAKASMAETVANANLTVAIVDMPVPNVLVPMTEHKYKTLYTALDKFIFESLLSDPNSNVHTFSGNMHTKGVMKIRCGTPSAKTWLTSAVQHIPNLWNGMQLAAMDFDNLPNPRKVLGLFRNNAFSNSDTIKLMGIQSKGLIDSNHWSVAERKISEHGVHMVFITNADQLAKLESNNMELPFGAGVAKFKDISKKQSNTEAQDEEMIGEDEEQTKSDTIDSTQSVDNTIVAAEANVVNSGAQMQDPLQANQNTVTMEQPNPEGENMATAMETDAQGETQQQC